MEAEQNIVYIHELELQRIVNWQKIKGQLLEKEFIAIWGNLSI